ncbi:MAG: YigZ family protein, partial [Acidobacteriota bacterium]
TPAVGCEAELREKGSRFLAFLVPITSEEDARALIETTGRRYADATHVCWAWRIGMPANERSTDAGEPSGTAGVPMLQVLRGRQISDAVALVVRWFGGVKLGKGGLARAYAGAVGLAADNARLVERAPSMRVLVRVPYSRVGGVKRLVQPPEIVLAEEQYGEQAVMVMSVVAWRHRELVEALADLGLEAEPDRPLALDENQR